MRSVALYRLTHDPNAAVAWLAALPAGPAKSAMVDGVVNAILDGQSFVAAGFGTRLMPPEMAFMPLDALRQVPQWIGGISDPAQKEAAYETFAEKWLKRDPAAATAWIAAAPLPQATKERLLKP